MAALPDHSVNRIFTSLGNIEATPLASLTFPFFTTGDVLYVTRRARNVNEKEEAGRLMFHHDRLTTLYVTGGPRCAVAVRTAPKFVTSEEIQTNRKLLDQDAVDATLTRIRLHSPTSTFSTSARLDMIPGQVIILDIKSFIEGAACAVEGYELKSPILGLTGDFSLRSTLEKKALMVAGNRCPTVLDMLRDETLWCSFRHGNRRQRWFLFSLSPTSLGVKLRVVAFSSSEETHPVENDGKDESGMEGQFLVCGPAGTRTVVLWWMDWEDGIPLEEIEVEGFYC
ncbi:hypothetical protein CPB85DRAFT_1251939 [Mucidula mucida]|nr:hypothetical protein CPB85DRAFT_1251939 [Mucidula mucida]